MFCIATSWSRFGQPEGLYSAHESRIGIHAGDYLITEAGFGADMGAERFFNIKCRNSGMTPDAAVLVATVRALKAHSGKFKITPGKPLPADLLAENPDDVRAGAANLIKQIENVKVHGVSPVVAINAFPTDFASEHQAIREIAESVGARVAVVPNVGAVRAVAARMFSSREFLAGLKVERYIGDGSEFESLREYVPGLDHRAIDWKASARHIKLLCQEFRAERNHQVVMAIDAGHLMSEPLDGIPRLDHAINAGLLLSWFCLRTGDRVGLVGFDDQIRTWADPLGGVHNFARLQHLTADLAYRRVETNFTLALAEITTRLRRRSLIVLITDFLDTITAELMVENVLRLSRRHLVLFVALRDPGLERRALAVPRSVTTLHEAVVANDFARERQIVIERLRLAGVHCIDTEPARFSMNLLNRYLDIKRRELI